MLVGSKEMWTDLYAPEKICDLVGNEGTVNQLFEWLKDWDDVVVRGKTKEVKQRFSKNWQDIPRLNARAAMLSGPPGVGKSSAVKIVCKHLGYQILEFNASDVRTKGVIQGLIGTLCENRSLDYWKDSVITQKEKIDKNEMLSAVSGTTS